MTTSQDAAVRPASRSIEDSIQFATAGVRLAGGTVTEEDKAACRRVLNGETTAEEELAALRKELGY
ncbi:antitoxin VbhA family protein [Rhodococcus tibetensis]|uniref:Antitoxin VbhA family protein n=1 Tax=Rhodococcus tibetensis TaxID=2965064 RepID=A0ABT1QBD4_9NOCA|nr:antitoxin VbhA family protein [Rhodococcus sp. FXJ9.536]MCQ4119589.1 antitoxin VbhA family protein [Rhodococcus sp. FXJ9.536]